MALMDNGEEILDDSALEDNGSIFKEGLVGVLTMSVVMAMARLITGDEKRPATDDQQQELVALRAEAVTGCQQVTTLRDAEGRSLHYNTWNAVLEARDMCRCYLARCVSDESVYNRSGSDGLSISGARSRIQTCFNVSNRATSAFSPNTYGPLWRSEICPTSPR